MSFNGMRSRIKRSRQQVDDSERRYRGMGPRGISKWVTREVLESHFHMSLDDTSKALGVSTTIIKRLCRKLGVSRWPYRQISSVDKNILRLQQVIDTTIPSREVARLQDQVESLRHQREDIVRNPMPLATHGPILRVMRRLVPVPDANATRLLSSMEAGASDHSNSDDGDSTCGDRNEKNTDAASDGYDCNDCTGMEDPGIDDGTEWIGDIPRLSGEVADDSARCEGNSGSEENTEIPLNMAANSPRPRIRGTVAINMASYNRKIPVPATALVLASGWTTTLPLSSLPVSSVPVPVPLPADIMY